VKWVRFAVVVFLLGALTIQADPFKTWSWEGPTEYENGFPIPTSDELSYRLLCGVSEGGPYDRMEMLLDTPSPSVQDMGALVENNPGTYYCVSTATSSVWNLTSEYSNEVNFTVLPSDLGLRPKPPVLSLVSV
jgi:hypothetical protein